MTQNMSILMPAKNVAARIGHDIHGTWDQIIHWDPRKNNVSSTFRFFSPSLVLIFFTLFYQSTQPSSHLSFRVLGLLILHAFIKLTKNPISTTLHFQILYKLLLVFSILHISPSLPSGQFRLLIAILFPLYYHLLTASIAITLVILIPILLFFLFLLPQGPIANPTLVPFVVMPAIIWIQSINNKNSKTETQAKKELTPFIEKKQDSPDQLIVTEVAPKTIQVEKMIPEPSSVEDHEKVILGISHDCRNLLSSLKAILTLMKDEANGDETQGCQDDNLQSAIAITEHLALLLTNLLNYLKRSEDNSNMEEMKLTSTLEKIWLMISPNLKKKNIDGSISIKKGTPLNVYLDERKFMGILLNLIGNAIKFTDSGNVKINVHWREDLQDLHSLYNHMLVHEDSTEEVSTYSQKTNDGQVSNNTIERSFKVNPVLSKSTFFDMKDVDSISFSKKCFTGMTENYEEDSAQRQGWLVVTVRDTGCGVDEESLTKLFTKYMQVNADPEKSKLGLGLGLWYTKYLLGKLNGKIDFRSTKGVGSWVQIEIPCKVVQEKLTFSPVLRTQPIETYQIRSSRPRLRLFLRDDDCLESLFILESLKKRLADDLEVVKIDSISEIVNFDELTANTDILLLEENAIKKENFVVLDRLESLHRRQKISIILLRENEMVENHLWENNSTDFFIKKPMGKLQVDQLTRNIETVTGRILFKTQVNVQNLPKDDKAHVLLVDDEKLSLLLIQSFFKKNGIQCLLAQDGLDALKIYKEKSQDIKVILMDSQMPKMNGLEASKAIREFGGDKGLKIFGLTGDDSEDFKVQAKECGMDRVYVKPAPLKELLQEVASALKV